MQNELILINIQVSLLANRCRCAVKSGAGSVFLSEFPWRGNPPRPSTPPQS
ncbi:Hypothetical protein FKW44_002556 [Caligus rogercresseyi]|uniref:Uncharacterized protein n=1 Tax=Caligus rogercresseyi TaxID=217165 RepID=A0A7T8KKJ6_CALRO|nr:Hypothetical protein FKW44_002556 [Caligus rogercresseyi]